MSYMFEVTEIFADFAMDSSKTRQNGGYLLIEHQYINKSGGNYLKKNIFGIRSGTCSYFFSS